MLRIQSLSAAATINYSRASSNCLFGLTITIFLTVYTVEEDSENSKLAKEGVGGKYEKCLRYLTEYIFIYGLPIF